MANAGSFLALSEAVAGEFLQTAVIIDDGAFIDKKLPSQDQVLVAPNHGKAKQRVGKPKQSPFKPAAALDAKALVDAFAEIRIVCAVLQPLIEGGGSEDTIDQVKNRTERATQRADIVILDWNLRSADANIGDTAKILLKSIFTRDRKVEGITGSNITRLRLVAVYTGESRLEQITAEIENVFQSAGLVILRRDNCLVEADAVKVVVYGKELASVVHDFPERRIQESDLPARIRSDFAEMTAGLLSNVALLALGTLRDNTHRIIRSFGKDVDAPYVAHRALLEPPMEAEELPVPLLAAEIDGVLADESRLSDLVSLSSLQSWLDYKRNAGLSSEHIPKGMSEKDFADKLMLLLEHGLSIEEKAEGHEEWREFLRHLNSNVDKKAVSRITDILANPGSSGTDQDMGFAVLTSVKSQYDAPPPVLALGTVVQITTLDTGKNDFYICIQPLCDSVRLTTNTVFPFLKLRKRSGNGKDHFDFVVSEQEGFKRLKVSLKPYDIRLEAMVPCTTHATVRATETSGGRRYFISNESVRVRWVATLKPSHAQRVAADFAKEIGRVGLSESEWLRRMAKPRARVIEVNESTEPE